MFRVASRMELMEGGLTCEACEAQQLMVPRYHGGFHTLSTPRSTEECDIYLPQELMVLLIMAGSVSLRANVKEAMAETDAFFIAAAADIPSVLPKFYHHRYCKPADEQTGFREHKHDQTHPG